MATIANHIEYLRKLYYAPLRQGVIDLYDNTGKEESKFFPLLNYAAMRMLLVEDWDGCMQRAAEWINDNVECLIIPASPSIVNANFAVSTVLRQDTVDSSIIKFGKSTIIGWQFGGMTSIMETNSVDIGANRRFIDIWPTVLLSVEYAMSDIFGKTLSNRKKELDTFPSMKRVLRSIKEYTVPNHFKEAVPLMVLIDEIRQRCGNDIIFPIIPLNNPYLGGKACLCHYNADSDSCTLFRKDIIARLNNMWALSIIEADEIMARKLLQEFNDGVNHIKGLIENMERNRNALLSMR